jgi:hypothetical protein
VQNDGMALVFSTLIFASSSTLSRASSSAAAAWRVAVAVA